LTGGTGEHGKAPKTRPVSASGVGPERAIEAATQAAETIREATSDDLFATAAPETGSGIDLLGDVALDVTVELGRTRMLVDDVLRLGAGSVVELDQPACEPVDICVNDRPVARGEIVVVDDQLCVRILEIIGSEPPPT
jgi:flagellar motor switch protein FliN/FliY